MALVPFHCIGGKGRGWGNHGMVMVVARATHMGHHPRHPMPLGWFRVGEFRAWGERF